MKFRPLPLACVCGQVPAVIQSVGLTSEYELVVQWTCEACERAIFAVKSLADCCRECPEAADVAAAGKFTFEMDDAGFLRSLGIRMPEE